MLGQSHARGAPNSSSRAARDHLADCLVTLPVLLEREAAASLHFWFANLDGMRQALFPHGDRRLCARGGTATAAVRYARRSHAGVPHWQRVCAQVLLLHAGGPDNAEDAIEALSSARVTTL